MGGGVNMSKLKHDQDKPRLALVPPIGIKAVGEIMTYGLTKYEEGSWRKVEVWRYRDALMRHFVDYLIDPHGVAEDSGLPHIWHMAANAMILCELEDPNLSEWESEHIVDILKKLYPGDGVI